MLSDVQAARTVDCQPLSLEKKLLYPLILYWMILLSKILLGSFVYLICKDRISNNTLIALYNTPLSHSFPWYLAYLNNFGPIFSFALWKSSATGSSCASSCFCSVIALRISSFLVSTTFRKNKIQKQHSTCKYRILPYHTTLNYLIQHIVNLVEVEYQVKLTYVAEACI